MKNQLNQRSFFYILIILNCFLINACQKSADDSILYQLVNSKYTHDTIRTVNMPDNADIIGNLTKELQKKDFTISAHTVENDTPEYGFIFDCVNLIQYDIETLGMRAYSVKSNSKRIRYNKSTFSKKKLTNYYYEFKIRVYEFENEDVAKKNYEFLVQISNAGNGNCNRTFNTRYIIRKNEIFEFSTMSEKSLNYMKEYMNFVEDH